jgi:dipeptidyl aminopeptidase/acylaminoacyl peptidase
MPKRGLQPGDLGLLRWAADAQISPDGEQVAWVETGLDLERDRPVSNVMVSPSTGGSARPFTLGPDDASPRWSPDGRYLAYLSVIDGESALHLAPLAGGVPFKVVTPGSVTFVSWSPSGDSLVLVVTVVSETAAKDDPKVKNAAKVVRGMANRLDGLGYFAGRDHLFIYSVEDRSLKRLTSGDYDHAGPCWSPDATAISCFSNRSLGRNDEIEFSDLLLIPAAGGRPVKVAARVASAADPSFSPDGKLIAFVGVIGFASTLAGRNSHLLVVPRDRSRQPVAVAPDLDRPVIAWSPVGNYAWSSNRELLFKVADRGTVSIHRAKVGARVAQPVVTGDLQVTSLTVARHRGALLTAFTAAWIDKPAEVFSLDLDASGGRKRQLSDAGRGLLDVVDLLSPQRLTANARDGTKIEYFIIRPRSPRRTPPMFLDIHGGPHSWNPTPELLVSYQTLAAAGYAVVLPNPRGSIGYGEEFAMRVNGDWGGEDYHDLLACADDVIRRGLVDADRQFVGGYSYGGYMSAWIVSHTDRFNAASIGAPVIDLVAEFGASDVGMWVPKVAGGDPWHSSGILQQRSPVTHIPNIRTPVFLYVFEGDLRCPPDQADALFNGLRWHRKEVDYVRYPGGSHLSIFDLGAPPSQNEDRLRRMLGFFSRHGGVTTKHHTTTKQARKQPTTPAGGRATGQAAQQP